MKVKAIALATALSLTGTLALTYMPAMAQTLGTSGYGSVVAPSVGSYQTSVGSTNQVPTWRNTGPAATAPRRSAMAQSPMGRTGRR
jgi:hypothetical protein